MKFLDIDEATLRKARALDTAREIAQQPACWRRTETLLLERGAAIRRFLAPLLAEPELRIILTGAGSSAFIGECLAPLLLQQLGRRVEAIAPRADQSWRWLPRGARAVAAGAAPGIHR